MNPKFEEVTVGSGRSSKVSVVRFACAAVAINAVAIIVFII
jgi:hypothetical protein